MLATMKTVCLSLLCGLFLMVGTAHAESGVDAPQDVFFKKYAELAQDQMKAHKIPASIKLAQAACESGYGTSTLAKEGNNFFGIKCWGKGDCTERVVKLKDDDYNNGELIKSTFMAFDKPEDSFEKHTQFLLGKDRYAFLFDLNVTDYKGWAKGLQKAGYATADDYATKLIRIIEDYELYKYDLAVVDGNSLDQLGTETADALFAAAPAPEVQADDVIVELPSLPAPNPQGTLEVNAGLTAPGRKDNGQDANVQMASAPVRPEKPRETLNDGESVILPNNYQRGSGLKKDDALASKETVTDGIPVKNYDGGSNAARVVDFD